MTHLSFLHLVLHLQSYIFQGAQAIEGLFLDRCKFNPSHLNRESFKEMNRLRLLKIRSCGPAFLTCAPTRSARLAFIW